MARCSLTPLLWEGRGGFYAPSYWEGSVADLTSRTWWKWCCSSVGAQALRNWQIHLSLGIGTLGALSYIMYEVQIPWDHHTGEATYTLVSCPSWIQPSSLTYQGTRLGNEVVLDVQHSRAFKWLQLQPLSDTATLGTSSKNCPAEPSQAIEL